MNASQMSAIEIVSSVARRTFARAAPKHDATPEGAVAWTIRYIVKHYAADIRLSALARRAGLSRFQFSRRFRKQTGMAPGAFLKRYRICMAMERLRTSDHLIQDIARQVGYQDAASFSRAFLQTVGTQPQVYRTTGAPRRRAQ
jgi:AraC-like DNA-binding protein